MPVRATPLMMSVRRSSGIASSSNAFRVRSSGTPFADGAR